MSAAPSVRRAECAARCEHEHCLVRASETLTHSHARRGTRAAMQWDTGLLLGLAETMKNTSAASWPSATRSTTTAAHRDGQAGSRTLVRSPSWVAHAGEEPKMSQPVPPRAGPSLFCYDSSYFKIEI